MCGRLSLSHHAAHPAYAQQSALHYQTLLYHDPNALMLGGGQETVEMIYAQHALRGTEPDWGAMGASDIGFAAGLCKGVGAQVKNVIELGIDLAIGIANSVEDPVGTAEGLVEKIEALPAYIEQRPAAFKAYLDEISAIEDPYQQGEALGKLVGHVIPTSAVMGNITGKIVGKVGKWKVTKARQQATKAAKVEGGVAKTLQQVLPSRDAFLKSAKATWKDGAQGTLSVAGRALSKHSGRTGSSFSNIKFSGKTANQDAMRVIKEILNSNNQVVEQGLRGGYEIYDATTRRGFSISRNGLFNGFRNYKGT